MAFLIPENPKSRPDVPHRIKTGARAFQVGLDEDVVVWYEPLYNLVGEWPDLVVLLPSSGSWFSRSWVAGGTSCWAS